MEIRSIQKYIHVSPRKLREVLPLVKSMKPIETLEKLPFSGKKASVYFIKAIQTAIANARQKGLQENDLIFKDIQVNEGPRLKRFRAAARGRFKPYVRQMSHIRIVLTTSNNLGVNTKTEKTAKTQAEPMKESKVKEVKK